MISALDKKLINNMSNKIYSMVQSDIITREDIVEAQQSIEYANDKLSICSALETMHYCFSVILTEQRQTKREVLFGIFEQKPNLANEKSVLEKKLDAEPEYARCKNVEDYLYQFTEHIMNIRNNINWLVKEDEHIE